MRRRHFVSILTLLTAAACSGGDTDTTASETDPAPGFTIEKKYVAATDEFGAGLQGVSSAAFWSHPAITFNSMVIAGHGDGVTSYNIEDGAEIARIDGFRTIDLAVGYVGSGPSAQGYLGVLTDDGDNPIRFYEISNEDRSLRLLSTIFVTQIDDETSLCLGQLTTPENLVAVQSRARGTSVFPLKFSSAGVSSQNGFSQTDGTVDCAISAPDQRAYGVNASGDLIIFDGAQKISLLLGGAINGPKALEVVVKTTEDGSTATTLVVLDGDGFATLFDAGKDSHALGAIGMRDTFDVIALENVTALAVGYGNYGGIYRDGALAFVDGGADGSPIKLAPWGGVIRELDLTLGGSVSPRGQSPAVEEDETVISIDFVQP